MKKHYTFVLLLLCAACTQQPSANVPTNKPAQPDAALPPVAPRTGLVQYGAGKFSFRDCATGLLYGLMDSTYSIGAMYANAILPSPCPEETVFVMAQTRLFTDPGGNKNTGIMAVVRIDSIAPKSPDNACTGVDFWCHGTEPFWALNLSEKEGNAYFKDIGAEQGRTFVWSAPKVEAGKWTYELKERNKYEGSMRLIIRQQKCSDGMSDETYPFSVEVQTDGKVYRGCAHR